MTDLHTRHTLLEKIFFRSTIIGGYLVGAYAIFLNSPWSALLYIAFMLISLEFVLMRFCARCPYPCDYSDCLMVPYKRVTRYANPNRNPMSLFDRLTFPLVMLVLLPLIPQYWLLKQPALLVIFWALFVIAWSAMLIFKCGSCRFKQCLLNRTK